MSTEESMARAGKALSMGTSKTYEGTVTGISGRFWGDWGWATLETDAHPEPIRFTGNINGVCDVGSQVRITGEWERTAKYGMSFKASLIITATTNTSEGVLAWLADNLPQIAASRAQAIVDMFGGGLWEVLDQEPSKLLAIPGLTEARVEDIAEAYQRHKDTVASHMCLYELGLSQAEILKLFKRNGAPPRPEQVRADPYTLYLDYDVGYARVLRLADAGGQNRGRFHLASAVEAAKRLSWRHGSTVVPKHSVESYLIGDMDVGDIKGVGQALESGYLKHAGAGVQLSALFSAERSIAASIRRIYGTE